MHVLEKEHTIDFDMNNDLEILNSQINVYINPVLEELYI